jgi:hypothetical protein
MIFVRHCQRLSDRQADSLRGIPSKKKGRFLIAQKWKMAEYLGVGARDK